MEQCSDCGIRDADAAAAFAALGSEARLTVLRVLVRAGPAGLATGPLGDRSGVSGSTLTHHVQILARAGLVSQRRDGRRMICAAADFGRVETLSRFLLTECCADAQGSAADD